MPKYIDGYILPLPKKSVRAYQRIAQQAGKIWKEHGALEYRECVGENLAVKICRPFTKQMKTKPSETVVFAYIVFKSRAHRDRVNAKVMKDPRMAGMDCNNLPFDPQRMLYGGFTTIVGFE